MSKVKPKLADGSRWEGGAIIDEDDRAILVYQTELGGESRSHAIRIEGAHSAFVADTLAAIRAAGLDEVWNAAVALSVFDVDRLGEACDAGFGDLTTLVVRLCQSVEEASEP